MIQENSRSIRWGMPTLIECANAEENMRLCKRLGLHFVELNMNLPMYQAENLPALRELADRYGVGFTIHMDENFNAADFNPAIRDAWLRTLGQAIEAAKTLGADVLNMHLAHGVYFTLPDRRVYLFDKYNEAYMRHMAELKSFCEQALEGTAIRICLENTDGFSAFEQRAIEMLLESERFALTWDIGHSHTAHTDDEPFLRAHEDRVKHFHIHDARGKSCHLELGEGEIDLDERLSLAVHCGAACVLETKTAQALVNSVGWLREKGLIV